MTPIYKGNAMRRRHGFTLIELLVVVTIIVVLLALLVPAMDKAIEAASRARCAANLHAFGVAIPQYAMENKRKLLRAVRFGNDGTGGGPKEGNGANGMYPGLVRNWDRHGPGQWSAERMAPYMHGADLERRLLGPQWYCPSNGKTAAKDLANQKQSSDDDPSLLARWLAIDYTYFARVDDRFASRPEDLVGNSPLDSGKLLMSDALYYWRGGQHNHWWVNHHAEGSSVSHPDWGSPTVIDNGIRGLSGTNQLFGDSAVIWKEGRQFDPKGMLGYSMEVGWVSRNEGPTPNTDAYFY